MDDIKQQVVDRLKQANNILVTVRSNPSIDLLSACIGLSLVLDKLDKHAAAVFSGEVPSAMEFLKPEETIEQTPNSLRDFIIALDKSKADKLRYKVEDKVVRIFITPYKTSLSKEDLEFSQGDFNIDVVVALGVHDQAELDEAITTHGRILHDATVISINNTPNGNLGSLNWQKISASSVSEMVTELALQLGEHLLDEQIATALLTGVVAETARFSNDKTTPQTMRVAGELMAAGANQQLVANELRKNASEVPSDDSAPTDNTSLDEPGTLQITHPEESSSAESSEQKPTQPDAEPVAAAEPVQSDVPEPTPAREMMPMPEPGEIGTVTEQVPSGDGLLAGVADDEEPKEDHGFLIDQPTIGGQLAPNPFASPVEPPAPILTHSQPVLTPTDEADNTHTPDGQANASQVSTSEPTQPESPAPSMPLPTPLAANPVTVLPEATFGSEAPAAQTLASIEASVNSPHVTDDVPIAAPAPVESLNDARMQVLEALRQGPQPLVMPQEPRRDLNSNPFGPPLHEDMPSSAAPLANPTTPGAIEVDHDGNIIPVMTDPSVQPPEPLSSLSGVPTPNALDMPLPPVMPQPQPGESQMSDQGNVPPQVPPPGPPPFTPPSFM